MRVASSETPVSLNEMVASGPIDSPLIFIMAGFPTASKVVDPLFGFDFRSIKAGTAFASTGAAGALVAFAFVLGSKADLLVLASIIFA